MALERQPKYAVMDPDAIKTYRPYGEWVGKWHTVVAKESFVTIAARYGVSAEQIIQLNFPGAVEGNHVVPEIVNWYLRNHVDFQGCPETHDRRNRMFKGGELLAIPRRVITLPEIELRIQRPKQDPGFKLPDLTGVGDIFTGEKFAYEFKIPKDPKEVGYFLVQFKGSLEGELAQRAGIVKTQFKKDQIKFQIEQKLNDDLKAAYSLKIDQKKTIDAISEAIKKGSKEEFVKAIAGMFEFSLKDAFFKGSHGQIYGELGAEFSLTPVILRLAGEYKFEAFAIGGFLVDGKFTLKGGVNVGLSKAGWAEVAKRVGWEAIKRFMTAAGRSLAATWELMVAEGIVAGGAVVAGTVLGTLAITALMAWLVADARRKGELRGLSRWYSSAYKAKVFRYPRPTGFILGGPEANQFRDELVALGEKDAVAMADAVIRDLNETALYSNEVAKLDRLAGIMISTLGNGSQTNAEQELLNRLNMEMERKLGL